MESTTTDQPFSGADASLSEPHFDEEATVLSARPVVPLTTINGRKGVKAVNARTSFPRPWILGLALVGTLLIGIFATAVYYSRLNRNDSQLVGGAEAAGGEASPTQSEGFSGPAVVQPAVEADTLAEVRRQPARNQPSKASSSGSGKPVPRLVAVITEKGNRNEAVESREDRKAARRQARQERRREEREKRKSSDDLLRIRDIFEGSPRP